MESEETMKRAAGLPEIYEGKEVYATYLCPHCGKQNKETDYTKELPGQGDKVTCDHCGRKSIVVTKP